MLLRDLEKKRKKNNSKKDLVIHQSFFYSMTRTTRGIARRRRNNARSVSLRSQGAHSKFSKQNNQQRIRGLFSSTQDRKRKKREFRHLWITRINAVIRERGVSYSKLINNMYEKQLLLNRKIFAHLAISNRPSLDMISNDIFGMPKTFQFC